MIDKLIELKEFLAELEYNQKIEREIGGNGKIDLDYVVDRLKDIIEEK